MKFKNNKQTYIVIFIIIVLSLLGYYFISHGKFIFSHPDNNSSVTTGNTTTGGSIITGNIIIETGNNLQMIEFSQPRTINNSVVKNTLYPMIQINDNVSNVQISFEVDFTDYFKKRYSSYINAPRYYFAFKFFIGDIPNGGFYNVIRNDLGGVSNTKDGSLTGALLGKDIIGGYVWDVPGINAKVANNEKSGYTTFSIENVINNNVGKQLRIGGYLSSTKDMKGWNFTLIKKITIQYIGPENALQFVE